MKLEVIKLSKKSGHKSPDLAIQYQERFFSCRILDRSIDIFYDKHNLKKTQAEYHYFIVAL